MEKKTMTFVLGTARKDRQSERVFSLLEEVADGMHIAYKRVDVRDLVTSPETIPSWAENRPDGLKRWQELVSQTSALIFVVPEYNHGYPGEFKLLLDSLTKEYAGVHVGLIGVSEGAFGGVRLIEHLQPIINYLKMVYLPYPVMITEVKDIEMNVPLRDQHIGRIKTLLETAQKAVA